MDDQNKSISSLEALLFLHGEPVSYKKIAAVLAIEEAAVAPLVDALKEKLQAEDRGLHLVVDKEKVQMATKPEFAPLLEAFVKEELTEELSAASLEALAIIAYLGPISRARIEYLRGVNSIVILRSLMLRGLVERFPDPQHPSGFVYAATFDFLKHLGFDATKALPDYEKFQKLLEVFEEKAKDVSNTQVLDVKSASDSSSISASS